MKPMLVSKNSKPPLPHLSSLLPPAPAPPAPPPSDDICALTKLINSHNIGDLPELFRTHILPSLTSSPLLLPSILSRLHSAHSSAHKSLRLFLLSLPHHHPDHLSLSLDHTLHSLSRARLFSSALSLLRRLPPPLLSPHSLSILLSYHSKFHPFDQTLRFFHLLHHLHLTAGLPFTVDHFNSLLRSFSVLGRVADARAVFNRMHSHFPPNSKTLNILLLGFKESGHIQAFDLFYHDMLLRGFVPDVVTYNIRIDAYCKRNRFVSALEVAEEMEGRGFLPTVRTLTTLIHGAGIAKNPYRARKLFDEISDRGLEADKGAYNALMGALVRVGDLNDGAELMDEMEGKGVGVDDVSYYTLFCGLKKAGDFEGFCRVYRRMVERGYVPRVRTVMLLMKFFCERRRSLDLGMELWDYLVDKGCCPHRHALDLLATGLCSSDKVMDAYGCFKQVVERGRWPSQMSVLMLEGALRRSNKGEKLDELKEMMKSLESLGPPQYTDDEADDD